VEVAGAHVFCSGRKHGNVGDHVGDDPALVDTHRRALAEEAGLVPPTEWVWLRQVHGAAVHVAEAPTGEPPPEADGAVTAVRNLPIAVVTADCAPVVVASEHAVAVVHAGHRGLLAGVIEAAVARLREVDGSAVSAFLGPCIHPSRYEFGATDLDALVAHFGPEVASQTSDGRPAFDIPAAVEIALARAGVDSFVDADECTAESDAYFSYRRDGATGRQATIAVLL
jgi:YfiH family protein